MWYIFDCELKVLRKVQTNRGERYHDIKRKRCHEARYALSMKTTKHDPSVLGRASLQEAFMAHCPWLIL